MKTTVLALCAAVLLFLIVVVAVVDMATTDSLDDQSTPLVVNLIGMVVLAIPTLLAAAFAERASRDIRNGTLKRKVKEGAKEAIEEKGVLTTPPPAVTSITGAHTNDDPVERGRVIAEALDAYKRSQEAHRD